MAEEKLWAYYDTLWMKLDLAEEFLKFFGEEIEVIQYVRRGEHVKMLTAISQEGLAKGRAEWEKIREKK